MGGKVSVSVRSIVVTGVLLVGLVAAYLLGAAGRSAPPASAARAEAGTPHTLVMAGTGSAIAVPDRLSFSLGVGLTRPALDTALGDTNRLMARVLRSLSPYGVERADVQTTGLQMYPVYDYHQYAPPTIRGYRVSQQASVLVKELAQGGRAVSAAVTAGGNAVRVSNISLRVGDPEATMKKARDAAVVQATAKAEQYAAATGQELGDVVSLREVHASPRNVSRSFGYQSLRGVTDTAGLAALPVRAGRDRLGVTVQVVWQFA